MGKNIFLICCFVSLKSLGQTPVADFTIKSNLCLQEQVETVNQSTDASSYEWDFCPGELSNQPTAVVFDAPSGAPFKVELIEQNGSYFGFYTVRGNQKLYRLEFGTDANSTPSKVDLGNLGTTAFPQTGILTIDIVMEGDNYFGFIVDYYNRIYRISFGNSITNSPSNVEVIYSGTLLNNPVDLVAVEDGSGKFVFVSNSGSSSIVRLNLGSLYGSDVTSINSDLINHGFGGQGGISFIRDNNFWYAMVSSLSGNIFRVHFDGGLSDLTPTISGIMGLPFSDSYYGISSVLDNDEYYVFVQSPTKLYRLYFGNSISNLLINGSDLGNFNLLTNVWGFSMHKVKSDWLVFSCENSGSNNIYKIKFQNSCFSNTEFSTEFEPILRLINSGTYSVSLIAKDASGQSSSVSKSILILNNQSPDIQFTSQNSCANHDINFTSQNTSGDITDYHWDFGDTNTSMLQDPTHQYNTASDYPVSLQVTASNGCNNIVRDTITIYNEPLPNFTLPSASPICSNQEYLFTNTSTFDAGSNPTWNWEVNGVPVSTNPDLLYTIPATVMQDIKLKATIPGCENEITQTINTVEDGPLADFTFANDCEDKSILFTNTTTGTVTSYLWDFGDGNSSTQTNGTNAFADFGLFNVNLVASNVAGCENNITKPITIYSKPATDFSIDLPPFSCSGSISQFNDLTPNPPDSNLESWDWSFGDPLNGTSQIRNAQYTYALAGDYNVNLEVTTNFGCSESIQKMVTILPSPNTDFTFNPACVNQGTSFLPTSIAGINSWQWKIGTATYTQENPIHVFGSSSTYNAELTAIGSNGCLTVITKPVVVPIPASPNFSSGNNCAQQSTLFTDLTSNSTDPVMARLWEFSTLGTGTGISPSFIFPAAGAYPTKMTVTTASGCKYAISKNINIGNTSVPTFTATPQVGTPPLTVKLSNTSSNVASQLWTANNPGNSTSTEPAPSFIFSELGQYVIDLTILNTDGCASTTSKIISVIVPSLDIELSSLMLNPSTTGEINLLLAVKNNSNSPITNPKAVVDISGEAIITEVLNTTIQPGQSYSQVLFTSIVQASGGVEYICVEMVLDGDKDLSNNKICVNQNSTSIVMDPHPNPGIDQVNLDWITAGSGSVDVYIFDRVGRKVYDYSIDNVHIGLNRITVPLEALSPGLYYILFSTNGVRKSFPYVVKR